MFTDRNQYIDALRNGRQREPSENPLPLLVLLLKEALQSCTDALKQLTEYDIVDYISVQAVELIPTEYAWICDDESFVQEFTKAPPLQQWSKLVPDREGCVVQIEKCPQELQFFDI